MMTLSTTDIDALEAGLAKTTPRPWTYEIDREGSSMGWILAPRKDAPAHHQGEAIFDVCGDSAEQQLNAEVIVAAINALPALIVTARRVQALEDALDKIEHNTGTILLAQMIARKALNGDTK